MRTTVNLDDDVLDAARAIARTERPISSRSRRYAPSSPAIEAVIIRDQGSSGGPLTGWAFIRASFRLVCRYRSGDIFCSKREWIADVTCLGARAKSPARVHREARPGETP